MKRGLVRTKRQVHRLPVLPPSAARKSKDSQWLTPQYSAASIVSGGNRPYSNICTSPTSWAWILSAYTATFSTTAIRIFPAAGNRNETALNNRGTNGNYWSASLNSQTNGYNLNFNSTGVNPANNNNRFNGFSVRAVQHSSTIVVLCLRPLQV